MLPFTFGLRRVVLSRCFVWARTRTTSDRMRRHAAPAHRRTAARDCCTGSSSVATAGARRRRAGSATRLARGAAGLDIEVAEFRDGYFPFRARSSKIASSRFKRRADPDLVFTHRYDDAHQDHRMVSELTWNTFRDYCILEYEIPEYDGDLGRPSVFVPLSPGDPPAQSASSDDIVPQPAAEALVFRRPLRRTHAHSRRRMRRPRGIRRGISRPQVVNAPGK